jgi:hypothetical protein
MKATIKLLEKQHAALVQVIQFLDSHKHSDEPVRDSEMELTRISLK